MTRKEEIQAEIAKLQAELEELDNHNHYVLWSTGEIDSHPYIGLSHINQGNTFATVEH